MDRPTMEVVHYERVLLVLTVALVMAAMVVGTAATAFADKGSGGGGGGHVGCATDCLIAGGGNGDAAGPAGTPGGGASLIRDDFTVIGQGSGGTGIGQPDSGGLGCNAGSNTGPCKGSL